MTVKALIVTSLVALFLCVPLFGPTAAAEPIPGYFEGEYVGLLCVRVTFPEELAARLSTKLPRFAARAATSNTLDVLFQLNFDPVTGGGIDLPRADELFEFMSDLITEFGPLGGSFLAQRTCELKPSVVQSQYGLDALQVALQLTGTYQDFGFALYTILDVFKRLAPPYLGEVPLLRTDSFLVSGFDDLVYTGSFEVPEEFAP
jgi:hypothetical protein